MYHLASVSFKWRGASVINPPVLFKQHVELLCFTTSVCKTGTLGRHGNGRNNAQQKHFTHER